MKKINLLLVMLSLVFVVSCSKNDEDNPNVYEEPQYKIIVTSLAFTNGFCTGSDNTSYNIKAEYISNLNVIDSKLWNSSHNNVLISDECIITGKNIGVKLTLPDFKINDQKSGFGTEFKNIRIQIYTLKSNILLLDENIGSMFICTDTIYQTFLVYNVESDTFTFTKKTNGF